MDLYNNEIVSNLILLSRQRLDGKVDSMFLFKAYNISNKIGTYYRLIFYSNQGFVQNIFILGDPSNSSQLMSSQIIIKQQHQQFININSDPFISYVQYQINVQYPEFSRTRIVDAFVSINYYNQSVIQNYRVFFVNGNVGIQQRVVKINVSEIYNSTDIIKITQYYGNKLTKNVNEIIRTIININNYEPYLIFSNLKNVVQLNFINGTIAYNIKYQHPDVVFENGQNGASYFVIHVIPQSQTINNISNDNLSIGNLTNGNSSALQMANVSLIDVYLFKQSNVEYFFNITSYLPTNQQIDSLIFIKYINTSQIIQLNIYYSICKILQQQYISKILDLDLINGFYAQNNTNEIYQLHYEYCMGIKQKIYVFIFNFNSNNRQLSIIRNYTIYKSQIKKTLLDDLNRAIVMANIEPQAFAMFHFYVRNQKMLDHSDKLVQVTMYKYQAIDINNILVNMTSAHFKYYHQAKPSNQFIYNSGYSGNDSYQQSPNYQHIQFRYQRGSHSISRLGTIIIPYDTFVPVQINSILKIFIQGIMELKAFSINNSTMMYYYGYGDYKLINLSVSTNRNGVYRALYNISLYKGGEIGILYQIITGDNPEVVVISISDPDNITDADKNIRNNYNNNRDLLQNNNNGNDSNAISQQKSIRNKSAIISEQQINKNITLMRFKQFIEQQFYQKICDKQLLFIQRVNPDNFISTIQKNGYDIKDVWQLCELFFYNNNTNNTNTSKNTCNSKKKNNNNAESIIAGLITQNFQVLIVKVSSMDVKNINDILDDNSNNGNHTDGVDGEDLTNTSDLIHLFNNITKNMVDEKNSSNTNDSSRNEIISFTNLSHKYKSLTNMSITNPLLHLQFSNKTLKVYEPSGKCYILTQDNILPNISIKNVNISITSQDIDKIPLNDIKNYIGNFLGNDSINIDNVVIVKGQSLLGFIDTYTLEFSINGNKINTGGTGNIRNSSTQKNISNTTLTYLSKHQIPLRLPSKNTDTNKKNQPVLHRFTFQILRESMGKNNESNNNISPSTTSPITPNNMKNIINMQTAANNPLAKLLMSKIFDAMLIQSLALIKYNIKDNENKQAINDICDGNMLQGYAVCKSNPPQNQNNITQTQNIIIPLEYEENYTPFINLSSLTFGPPQTPNPRTLTFLKKKVGLGYKPLSQRVSNTTNSNITLITVEQISNKLGSFNIWGDINKNNLYKIQSIDSGYFLSGYNYTDFSKYPLLNETQQAISSQLTINILKKLNYTIQNNCSYDINNKININKNNIIYWRLKKLQFIQLILFYYQLPCIVIKIQIFVRRNNLNKNFSIMLNQFILFNNHVNQFKKINQQYRYNIIQNITSMEQFKNAEIVLKKSYGFYLLNAKIVDISTNYILAQIIFNIRYATNYSSLQATLSYNTQNKSSKVISLTLPTSINAFILAKGCKVMGSGYGCEICQNNYYLHRDKNCYQSINGCKVQSGILCIQCEIGYILYNNICQ